MHLNRSSVDIFQKKTEDREFFNSLVEDIDITPVDIADVTRLGTKVAISFALLATEAI